jgi:p21-activated kinase 1
MKIQNSSTWTKFLDNSIIPNYNRLGHKLSLASQVQHPTYSSTKPVSQSSESEFEKRKPAPISSQQITNQKPASSERQNSLEASQNESATARDSEKVTKPVAAPLIGSPTMPTQPPKPRQQSAQNDFELLATLKRICSAGDPTKLHRNLRKIGQGASGGVYTAHQISTNLLVAIKKMNLASQPKKNLVVNEILAMKESKHKNIVDYVDSFLHKDDLWIVMEYMNGCSLMDIITTHIITEGQMDTVFKEV